MPDGHPLSPCPSQSTWEKDHHLMDTITEPHVLYRVLPLIWAGNAYEGTILHPDEQKQSKFHGGKYRLERREEQCCPQPRLTCLLVTWPQTAAPVVPLTALSSEQVSPRARAPGLGSQSPSGRRGSEAGWRAWRQANGKRAKVILKNPVGNPVTGEVTEMVLTFILWKHLPLISA